MQNKKYGEYGGQYVAESLMNVLKELESAYNEAINDPEFIKEYHYYLKEYVGRETPLYFAEKLSKKYGTKIYLKREDLNHTGAHKINNVIGQILLAKRMGKKKVIAETGAGQHGVATATGAALFDMECTVFMGEEDMERQALNVFRMEMLGTKVECVKSGSRTLKDATNEAIRTWAKNAEDTFYIIGSAVGPHPYPQMVKEFQRVISVETKKQILEKEGRLPDCVLACVGGGSNSIGMFAEFIDEKDAVFVIGNSYEQRNSIGNQDRYNSVFVFEPQKNVIPPEPEIYSKIHLVPFTEYFPFKEKFPKFYKKLLNGDTQMWEKGKEYKVFCNKNLYFSTPICFEDTFGDDCRKFVKNGARCFFNLSNDAWSKSDVCQTQHLSIAVFRSVENKVPSVRSTSSGQTCIINEYGKVIAQAPSFCESYVIGKVPILHDFKISVYSRFGDFAGKIEVISILLILIIKLISVIIKKVTKR